MQGHTQWRESMRCQEKKGMRKRCCAGGWKEKGEGGCDGMLFHTYAALPRRRRGNQPLCATGASSTPARTLQI